LSAQPFLGGEERERRARGQAGSAVRTARKAAARGGARPPALSKRKLASGG